MHYHGDKSSSSELNLITGSTIHNNVYDRIRELVRIDPKCIEILKSLTLKGDQKISRKVKSSIHRYVYRNGLIYYRIDMADEPRLYVPGDEVLRSEL